MSKSRLALASSVSNLTTFFASFLARSDLGRSSDGSFPPSSSSPSPGSSGFHGGQGQGGQVGGSLDDVLDGGADNDIITGGGGADQLIGREGDDRLEARDGVTDVGVDCGDGAADVSVTDSGDPHATGCETDDRGAFGFLDPSLVIRSAHIIPSYGYGKTQKLMGPSLMRRASEGDEDWILYTVNM